MVIIQMKIRKGEIMVWNVKQYKPPIKGTIACRWCGCTNHAERLKTIMFFRIDGIKGCAGCWNVVKNTLNFMGITTDYTEMRKIVQIMKKIQNPSHGVQDPKIRARR